MVAESFLAVGFACTLMASGSGLAVAAVEAHLQTEKLGRAGEHKGCWRLDFASVDACQQSNLGETAYGCAQTAQLVRHASSAVGVRQIGRVR